MNLFICLIEQVIRRRMAAGWRFPRRQRHLLTYLRPAWHLAWLISVKYDLQGVAVPRLPIIAPRATCSPESEDAQRRFGGCAWDDCELKKKKKEKS